jgi:predicted GNAT superfamily acetyltransferase
MGFLADPDDPVLHSHITGVLADAAGRGIGRALKDFQASWCHAHGIDLVTWTYDPLVARNAWFNLARLGVEVDEYLVDFYGDMPDERNHGQGSDRLHVTWDVTSWPPDDGAGRPTGGVTDRRDVVDLVVDEDGRPRTRPAPPPDDAVLAVAVPDDIEGLRADDPALAVQWRRAVRAARADRLGTARSPGAWRIAAFTRDRRYLLVPRRPGPAT